MGSLKKINTMQQLELKHIAPYFPYGLKMTFRHNGKIGRLRAIFNYDHETHPIRLVLEGMDSEHIWMFKPILKPISQLDPRTAYTYERLLNFVGLGKWCDAYDEFLDICSNDMANIEIRVLQAPQPIFNYFLSEHFDVFGLIGKGLAISVNDIK